MDCAEIFFKVSRTHHRQRQVRDCERIPDVHHCLIVERVEASPNVCSQQEANKKYVKYDELKIDEGKMIVLHYH